MNEQGIRLGAYIVLDQVHTEAKDSLYAEGTLQSNVTGGIHKQTSRKFGHMILLIITNYFVLNRIIHYAKIKLLEV